MKRFTVAIAFGFPVEVKTYYLPASVTSAIEFTVIAEDIRERRLALAARLRVLADMIAKDA